MIRFIDIGNQTENTSEGISEFALDEKAAITGFINGYKYHDPERSEILRKKIDALILCYETKIEAITQQKNHAGTRKVEVILRDGKYGVTDNGIDAVPFIYENQKDAISEWEHFERLNAESEPHRRFLKEVTPIEFINEVVSKYN